MTEFQQFNRELSWLSFNQRVLQEAADSNVPLMEKIKFLAIFSSNLDEFYRVRVASYRNLLALKEKTQKKLDFDPAELISKINKTVFKLQELLGSIFRDQIMPELNQNNIFLFQGSDLAGERLEFAREFFETEIRPFLQPVILVKKKVSPFLQNRALYFAVRLYTNAKPKNPEGKPKARYALVEIPSDRLNRFIVLPEQNGSKALILLDEIIRLFLGDLFPGYRVDSAYALKLTRDAEIYIDDEFSGNLLNKIKKGLGRRKTGVPSRFLFDPAMPGDFLKFLIEAIGLSEEDLVHGGRFHNFNDFFSFPNLGDKSLEYEPMPPLPFKTMDRHPDFFELVKNKDQLLHFPYQSYQYVVDFLHAAAVDPLCKNISVTLYRVAAGSKIVSELIRAAQNGKVVMAFVELKARFDEASNIESARQMEEAGVNVFYSFPGLKVHSKLLLIAREENGRTANYAYLATGNFNEKTARIYCDMGLFTANQKITSELEMVFRHLARQTVENDYKTLLVAPFNMRKQFNTLIKQEMENVRAGKAAGITLKLNSLQDRKMIHRLYEASNAGVKIRIIVRGICCLIPGIEGQSENIEVISIVDRFLEHARVYLFHNDGDPVMLTGSADWMRRNLSRRIEVIFPILDRELKQEISDLLELQWRDNVKARRIDAKQKNEYIRNELKPLQAQPATYEYLKKKDI